MFSLVSKTEEYVETILFLTSIIVFSRKFFDSSRKTFIACRPTKYDPSNINRSNLRPAFIFCFVPKLTSVKSPLLPPKNSAGIKEIGCSIKFW